MKNFVAVKVVTGLIYKTKKEVQMLPPKPWDFSKSGNRTSQNTEWVNKAAGGSPGQSAVH